MMKGYHNKLPFIRRISIQPLTVKSKNLISDELKNLTVPAPNSADLEKSADLIGDKERTPIILKRVAIK